MAFCQCQAYCAPCMSVLCCVHPICLLCTPCRPCRDGSSASGRGVLSMQGLSHGVAVLCTPMSVLCCVHLVCLLCTPCRPCRDGSSASGRGVLSMQGLSHGVVRVNSGSNLTSLTLQDCGQVLPGGNVVCLMYMLALKTALTRRCNP